jgi:hypothetical protein
MNSRASIKLHTNRSTRAMAACIELIPVRRRLESFGFLHLPVEVRRAVTWFQLSRSLDRLSQDIKRQGRLGVKLWGTHVFLQDVPIQPFVPYGSQRIDLEIVRFTPG